MPPKRGGRNPKAEKDLKRPRTRPLKNNKLKSENTPMKKKVVIVENPNRLVSLLTGPRCVGKRNSDKSFPRDLKKFVKKENEKKYFIRTPGQTERSTILYADKSFFKNQEEQHLKTTSVLSDKSKFNATVKMEKTEELTIHVENVICSTPVEGSDFCSIKSESSDGQNMLLMGTAVNICEKNISEEGRLKKHLKSHIKNNAGNSELDKNAFGPSEINQYTRTPTGERPVTCTKCGHCFTVSQTYLV